jgi:hypothetical protein
MSALPFHEEKTCVPRLDLEDFVAAYGHHASVVTADHLTVDDIVMGLLFAQDEDDYWDTVTAYCDAIVAEDFETAMTVLVDVPVAAGETERMPLHDLFSRTRTLLIGAYTGPKGALSLAEQYEQARHRRAELREDMAADRARLGWR